MHPLELIKAAGDAWGRGTQSFLEAQRSLIGAIGSAAFSAKMPDLASVQAAQTAYAQAWSNAQTISLAFAGTMGGARAHHADPIAADILAKIFDPRGWLTATNELDEALNRMAEGPRLADLWNVERKFTALFTAWAALRQRNLEHNTIMLEAWTRATDAFSKAVNARFEAGDKLGSPRELMNLWIETANDVLLETQRSDAFLCSQRETLRASTDVRLAQQDLVEFYSQMFGLPTRMELDDVHRSVTELRREVRALSRAKRPPGTAEASSA